MRLGALTMQRLVHDRVVRRSVLALRLGHALLVLGDFDHVREESGGTFVFEVSWG